MDMHGISVEQPETLTRVDDLWFPTNIIVIRAENKIFRVLGGILEARSTVFRDMVAFPQPDDSEAERIDGFPVVRLLDSAEDVEVFLRAIFDSSYFMPAPVPFPMSAVLGILRLSHKYDVPFLHRRALDHLVKDGWYWKAHDDDWTDHLTSRCGDQDFLASALSIIPAAIEVNAPWLLPSAYYCAATYSAEELLPLLEGKKALYALKALSAHAHLVRGLITVENALTAYVETCTNAEQCDRARGLSLARVLSNLSEDSVSLRLSKDEIKRHSVRLTADGMCSKCLQSAAARQHEATSAFWDELPNIFRLQPWEDLHAMARAAMKEGPDEGIRASQQTN
ncbi:BTB domain-containing protein [Mycena sanguinolenta]|uniref:BTB domain-containing protein n=1 Tax=Mycena sanguinolenta TaxID=230812 RepID=A0A8H7D4G4_9AGAR|nr:BTB domain-containing protein [Mycena sanguinolenta]